MADDANNQEDDQGKFTMNFDASDDERRRDRRPQEYYDEIKARFAEERDLRLTYRPPGTDAYMAAEGVFERYETDPYAESIPERDPLDD